MATKTLTISGAKGFSGTSLKVITGGIKGVSKVSAMRILDEIHNTFYDNKFKNLKKLFKLDTDDLTMKEINLSSFESAIAGLNTDERSMAYAYFLAINTSETHYVDMTMTYETISPFAISVLHLPAKSKGIVADNNYGGGANTSYGSGTMTIVVMDSKVDIGDFTYAPNGVNYPRFSTPAELLSHELLGHGHSRVIGSSKFGHEDAVQMSNLYWRTRGYFNFYRDGTSHGSGVKLTKAKANSIPSHFIK